MYIIYIYIQYVYNNNDISVYNIYKHIYYNIETYMCIYNKSLLFNKSNISFFLNLLGLNAKKKYKPIMYNIKHISYRE